MKFQKFLFASADQTSDKITQDLEAIMTASQNPFVLALKLFANADQLPKKGSLSLAVFEALQHRKTQLDSATIELCLDDDIRMVAFNFISDKNLTFIKLAIDLFELVASKELFIAHVKQCIEKRHFKEAVQLAGELEICHEFAIEEFFVPLYLDQKLPAYEGYLIKADAGLALKMIQFLDSLLKGKSSRVPQRCERLFNKYYAKQFREDAFEAKTVHKLIDRLIKKCNATHQIAPNNSRYVKNAQMSFHVMSHFSLKTTSEIVFHENVEKLLETNDPELQEHLLLKCVEYKKFAEAVDLMKKYNIPEALAPTDLRQFMQTGEAPKKDKVRSFIDDGWSDTEEKENDGEIDSDEAGSEMATAVGEYFELKSSIKITIVDTPIKLQQLKDEFSEGHKHKVVGFDVEQTPSHTASIIQLATRDAVFIIDVLAMQNQPASDFSCGFIGERIFNDDNILKLGFDLDADVLNLQMIPAFNVSDPSPSYIDLQELGMLYLELPNLSLHTLTKLCFNKGLDKTNRLSNWSRRPLLAKQINYAALDAFVLIEIFDEWMKE